MVTSSTYQWVVQTGYVKGVRATVARWLQARLGEVPPDLQRALDEAEDPEALDRATEALGRVSDTAELPGAVLRALREAPPPSQPQSPAP